jgi:tRNA-specific 2-thiouridylase
MTQKPFTRVLVAMSGGVDSSVAAALVRDAGHEVAGVTLKLWGGEQDSGCCSVSDVEDARRVAAQLGIDHYVWNLTEEFEARVVEPYVQAYASGVTPNPCIECNRTMKWGRLLERALALGYDAIATGHHARIVHTPSGARLARGADPDKDQSYVLGVLGERELAHTLLPVGTMTKAAVREKATSIGLRTATKPDSQDVCFVAGGDREVFLGGRIERRPGAFVDTSGATIGAHRGVEGFTIGQRRGLGVALGQRVFVVDIDAPTATVVLGDRDDLLRTEQPFVMASFVAEAPGADRDVIIQVRAHGGLAEGRVADDRVLWTAPQPRVAPGQSLVFYDGDIVLGAALAA